VPADQGVNSRWLIAGTLLVSLLLAIVPLPEPIRVLRPEFLLLFVIYWSLSAPRIMGLTLAWACGLLMDVLVGTVLGQHALGFLLVAYITHRQQLRVRVFPLLHQTFTVLMLFAVYEFVVFWIDGIVGPAITAWQRWLPVGTSALLWPVLVGTMESWNRRRRH